MGGNQRLGFILGDAIEPVVVAHDDNFLVGIPAAVRRAIAVVRGGRRCRRLRRTQLRCYCSWNAKTCKLGNGNSYKPR